ADVEGRLADQDKAKRRWRDARERKAPLCRVEEVDEPAKAGGTAQTSRASGFLATEACTPRGVATHLGKHWLNEPTAITHKAGNSNSGSDLSLGARCGQDLSLFGSVSEKGEHAP